MDLKGVNHIDLDAALSRPRLRDRIYRVGVELEGGWHALPKGITQLVHDGSVRGFLPTTLDSKGREVLVHTGELPSPPIEVSQLVAWMTLHYPQFVNNSCGLHVHMSFKTALTYQRLMTPTYPVTIIEYFRRWALREGLPRTHVIWPRLNGQSRYCQHVFYADEQARTTHKDHDQSRPGHRYTVINYGWAVHSTAECRLLPMMDSCEQSIAAVQELLRITNAFLVTTGKKESRHTARVIDDLGPDQDITELRV